MNAFAAVVLVGFAVAAPALPPKAEDTAKEAALRFLTAFITPDEQAAAGHVVAPFFDGRAVLDEKATAKFLADRWEGLKVPERHRKLIAEYYRSLWKPEVVRIERYETYRKGQTDRELVKLTDRVASVSGDFVVWMKLGEGDQEQAIFVRFTDGKAAVTGMHPVPSRFRALFKRDR